MSELNEKEIPTKKAANSNWTHYNVQKARNSSPKVNTSSLFLSGHGGSRGGTRSEAGSPQVKAWTPSVPRAKRQSTLISSSQRDRSDIPRADPPLVSIKKQNFALNRKTTCIVPIPKTSPSSTDEKVRQNTDEITSTLSPRSSSQSPPKEPTPMTPTTVSEPQTNALSHSSTSSTPSFMLTQMSSPMNGQIPTTESSLSTSNEDSKGSDSTHIKSADGREQSVRNRVDSGPAIVQPQPRVGSIAISPLQNYKHSGRQKLQQQKRFSENAGGLHIFSEPQFGKVVNSNIESELNSMEASSSTMSPVLSPLSVKVNTSKREETHDETHEKPTEKQEDEKDSKRETQPADSSVPQTTFPKPRLVTDIFPHQKPKKVTENKSKSKPASWDKFGLMEPRKFEIGDTKYKEADFSFDKTYLPSLNFVFGTKDSYGNEIDKYTLMLGPEGYETLTSEELINSGIVLRTKDSMFDIELERYNQATEATAKKKQEDTEILKKKQQQNKPKAKGDEKVDSVKKVKINVPEKIEIIDDAETCEPSKIADLLLGTPEKIEKIQQLEVTQDDLKENNIIKICICGTGDSGRGAWITRLLGYSCIDLANFNYLSKKVKINGIVNNVLFTLCNANYDTAASIKYRWADAFILAFSAHSRKSYEAIPNIAKEIVKDNGGRYKPTLITMNITSDYKDSSTWCATPIEVTMLSELLNIKLFKCDTPTSVVESFKSLCFSYNNRRASANMKSFSHTSSPGLIPTKPGNDKLSPPPQPRVERSPTTNFSPTVRSIYEFVVLGDSFSGKTTFVQKFLNGSFTKSYIATTTASSGRRLITLDDGKSKYPVRIIDTPGLFFIEQAATPELEDPIDNSVKMTIRWLKRQSLLHVQGYVILFSYTSMQSFEYACKLMKAIQSTRTEMGKGPHSMHLVGTKTDFKYTCTVTQKGADGYARMFKSGLSSLSLKSASQEDITLIITKMIKHLTGDKTTQLNTISKYNHITTFLLYLYLIFHF